MKTILTIILLTFSSILYSQVRLGSTTTEILLEFGDKVVDIDTTHRYITIAISTGLVYYQMHGNICISTTIVPTTLQDVQYYRNLYTKTYKQLSEYMWVNVTRELNFICEEVNIDGLIIFVWNEQ